MPDWFNDIAMSNVISISDRALDHLGKGGRDRHLDDPRACAATVTRSPITSGDRYADSYDISVAPLMDLASSSTR